MKKQLLALVAVGVMMLGMAGVTNAKLVVQGTVNYAGAERKLIYDTDLNITWLDYVNAPDTWNNQMTWAKDLSLVINGVTYDDWRLPSIVDDSAAYSGTLPNDYSYSGDYSRGYNVTTSEMGHLYYTELGNKGYFDTTGNFVQSYGLANTGDFQNFIGSQTNLSYWSSAEFAVDPSHAWYFNVSNGGQNDEYKYGTLNALAVRSGQVTAPESTTTTVAPTSTTTTTTTIPSTLAIDFVSGWNLVGNGVEAPITVAETFNDTTKVITVWKWVTSGSTVGSPYPAWAFYAPNLSNGGQAYAVSKGFEPLTTINAGEGFWVNAKKVFSVPLPSGEAVQSNSFEASTGSHSLPSGWSLISIGDYKDPAGFNYQLSTKPPTAGSIPLNVLTVWAWNAALSKWYFWSPVMVNQGTLTNYMESKGFLDFASMPTSPAGSITPSMGFWVNKQ